MCARDATVCVCPRVRGVCLRRCRCVVSHVFERSTTHVREVVFISHRCHSIKRKSTALQSWRIREALRSIGYSAPSTSILTMITPASPTCARKGGGRGKVAGEEERGGAVVVMVEGAQFHGAKEVRSNPKP